jgi:hypothetical protein
VGKLIQGGILVRSYKRLLLVLFAVIGGGVGFTGPTEAVNLPAYTWLVACHDENGVASNEVLDVTLPNGIYLVTAVGLCSPHGLNDWGTTVGTPCSTTTTGSIPCVTLTAQNLPGQACWESVLAASVNVCAPSAPTAGLTGCGLYGVTVSTDGQANDQCLSLGAAGLVSHAGGPMRARFTDDAYADNTGSFLVTAVFTPL